MAITFNHNDKFYVNGSNVGIGTSTPEWKLQIHENSGGANYIKITNDNTSEDGGNGVLIGISASEQATFWNYENTNMRFATNGTERVTITNIGRFGIGTTVPDTLLHIESTSDADSPIFTIENDNDIKLKLGAVRSAAGTAPDTTFIAYDSDLRFIADADSTTEVVRIDSTGNVGIGTDSPGAHLHVSASSDAHLLIESDNTMSFYQDAGWSSTMMFGAKWNGTNQVYGATTRGAFKMVALHDGDTSPQYLAIYGANHGTAGGTVTWNTVGFAQDEDGNVGIGTTSPGAKLEIRDTAPFLRITSTLNDDINSQGREYGGIEWYTEEEYGNAPVVTSYVKAIHTRAGSNHSNADAGLVFATSLATNDATATEKMRIEAITGNVGIGTTSPDFTLDVEKDVDTWVSRIYNTGSDANAQALLIRSDATAAHDATVLGVYADSGYKMVVKSTGNVGIGTTSPTALTSGVSSLSLGGTNSSTSGGLFYQVNGTYKAYSFVSNNAYIHRGQDDVYQSFWTDASERMRITAGGNVGIGTDDPLSTLHVSNATDITMASGGDGQFRVEGNGYTGAIALDDTSMYLYHNSAARNLVLGTDETAAITIHKSDQSLDFNAYGAGGLKGDATYILGVDSSGNVVETSTSGVYFGTNTGAGTYTNEWQRVLVIETGNFDSQGFRLRIEGTGNTSGQSIVAEIEFNYKNQNGAIRARTTVNSYGTHPVDKDDIAVYFDTTNLEATFYFKVTQNYTAPIYSIVSGRIRNYAFYSNVIGDDTALASETNDSITSNLKFQGITQDQDSGNVGIGTTSPGAKLAVEVAGTADVIKFTRDAGVNGEMTFDFSSANSNFYSNQGGFTFSGSSSSYGVNFTAAGNVGIGTTGPSEKLHLTESASNSYAAFRLEGSNRGGIIDMYQGAYPVSRYLTDQSGNIGIYTSGAFGSTTLTEKFAIATNGQIKLNEYGSNSFTGTAAYALAVDSSGNVIETAVSGANNWTVSGNSIYSNNAGTVSIGSQNATTDRRFQVTGSNTNLTAAQQFGIVNNPTYPTVVTSSVYNFYGAPSLTIGTTLTNLYNIYLSPNGIAGSTVTSSFGLYQAGGNDKNYFAGNVGIGTTSPGQKLHINDGSSVTTTDANNMLLLTRSDHAYVMFSSPDEKDQGFHFHNTTDNSFVGRIAYLHRSAGDLLQFKVGGTTSMTVSSGNVGIGTTDPAGKLEVSDTTTGIAAIIGNTTHNSRLQIYTAAVGKNSEIWFGDAADDDIGKIDYDHADNSMAIVTNNSRAITIDSAGDVGIGETSPTFKLEVKDPTSGIATIQVRNDEGTDGSGAGIRLYTSTDTYGNKPVYIKNIPDATGAALVINSRAADNSYSDTFYISGYGNVGIGTTSPGEKLHVVGNTFLSANSAYMASYNNTNSYHGSLVWAGLQLGNNGTNRIVAGRTGVGGSFQFWTNNTNNAADYQVTPDGVMAMSMLANGNIGIGTTSPSRVLHVTKSSGDSLIRINAVTGSYTGLELTENESTTANTYWQINKVPTDHRLQLWNGSERITVLADGNVGIGTTNPKVPLEIQGADIATTSTTTSTSVLRLVRDVVDPSHPNRKNSAVDFMLSRQQTVNNNLPYTRLDIRLAGTTDSSTPTLDVMSLLHNGNVGIGTTDPSAILHIGGGTVPASVLDGVLLSLSGNGQYYQAYEDGKQIFMGVDSSSYGIVGMLTNHDLGFRTNNTEQLRIKTDGTIQFKSYGAGFLQTDANGNITAGSVTTSDTLDDVTDNGSSTTNGITVGGVTSTSGGEIQGGDLYFANGGDDGAGTHIANVWYSVSTGGGAAPVGVYESAVIKTVNSGTHGRSDIVFQTKDNTTANFGSTSERMRITKDGRIGINETSPHAYLHIDGGDYPQLLLDGGSNTTGDIVVPDGEILQIGHWNNGTTTFTGRLWLSTSGHLGIGNNSPESLLHLGEAVNGANIISFGDASIGGPHGLDFYGDDATRTLKYSIYYRTGTENISFESDGGVKRFEITQAGAVTFNQAFTFPTADGDAGSALITDGSGALSWNAGYKQYSPVGWQILNNQTYTANGQGIQSSSSQALAGTTPVQRNSATEFQATQQGWYEIQYSFIIKNNYTNRAMVGAYMGFSHGSGGGLVSGSHSTQYVRYSTYGEYAQVQNSYYFYAPDAITKFYLYSYLLSGSMNMTTQALTQSMISFRYINNDIT